MIKKSIDNLPLVNRASICRIFSFMMWAGMLVVESTLINPEDDPVSAIRMAMDFDDLAKARNIQHRDIENLFSSAKLNISSPLFYVLLGEECVPPQCEYFIYIG